MAVSLAKKPNHSARKTQVQTLCAANVADSAVIQLSGHKSVQSLNHYKRPCPHLLSNYCQSSSVKQSPPPIVTAAQPSVNYAMLPHPTVSKGHLPLVNQAVQSHSPIICQEARSPLVNQAVQSRPPIVCQEACSPLISEAVQSRPPIVCQEARSPLISEAVQSRPPIVCQEARSPLISEAVQ